MEEIIQNLILDKQKLPKETRLFIYNTLLDRVISLRDKYSDVFLCIELKNTLSDIYNIPYYVISDLFNNDFTSILPEFNRNNVFKYKNLFKSDINKLVIAWFDTDIIGYTDRLTFIKLIIKITKEK